MAKKRRTKKKTVKVKTTRRFDGKNFRLSRKTPYRTKTEAKRARDGLMKQKKKARIVKGKTGYRVYKRG